MKPFDHKSAKTVDEAIKLLKTYNNRARMCIRCGEDVPYVYLVRAINVAADTQVTVAFADLK